MGSSGCALCADVFARGKLTPGDFKAIQGLLNSATLDPSVVITLRETSSVFCEECHNLLKETKRLQELLQTVTAQLDSLLAKVKAKYEESRSVWVKVEEDSVDGESSESSQMGFSIEPQFGNESKSVGVKEEEEHSESELSPNPNDVVENYLSSSSSDETHVSVSISVAPPPKTRKRKAPQQPKVNEPREGQHPQRRRSGKSSWPCVFCDLKFTKKADKFLHDETVHFAGASADVEGSTRLYSLICGKSSMTPGDLTTHNEIFHEAQLKFLCVSCDPPRKFISEDLLKAHEVIHTSGPFSCSLCSPGSMTFESSCDHDSHLLRLHTHSLTPPKDSQSERVGEECDNPPIPPNPGGIKKPPPCRFCGIQVKTNGLFGLRLHERKEHAEKFTHLCTPCRSTFAEENEVLTCQESHRKTPGIFKCSVCNAKFKNGPTLQEHLKAKHTVGGVPCDLCSERVVYDFALKIHKARVHGGEWPFKCPICQKGMEHKSSLHDHLRSTHSGEKQSALLPAPLSCDKCDLQFTYRKSLSRHKLRVHSQLGSFTCELCGKVLKSPRSFEIHRKAHLGIKDHVCDVCGKAFVNPEVLKMHLRVHTGEKPFVCHICQKGFSQRTPLTKHFDLHKKDGTWKEKPPKASSSAGP